MSKADEAVKLFQDSLAHADLNANPMYYNLIKGLSELAGAAAEIEIKLSVMQSELRAIQNKH